MPAIRETRGVIRSLVAAMATKPFLILAGISGSGKTQLARRLAAGLAAGGVEGGCYTGHLQDGPLHSALVHALVSSEVSPQTFDGGDPRAYIDVEALGPPTGAAGEEWVRDRHGRRRPGPALGSYRDILANRVAFLPVRPDWKDARQIWGTYNPLTGLFYPTAALRVVLHALLEFLDKGAQAGRHFLILDEMNLSRVEYYMSDLLSLMEAPACATADGRRKMGEMIDIHPFRRPVWTVAPPQLPGERPSSTEQVFQGNLSHGWGQAMAWLCSQSSNVVVDSVEIDFHEVIDGADWHRLVPPRLCLPPNLAIIGTVNVDETTFSFAPKVLDRAFVVEFDKMDFDAVCRDWDGFAAIRDDVVALHDILEPARLHFGYRVVHEWLAYLHACGQSWDDEADFLISSKVMPKVRGTEEQVGPALRGLLAWLVGAERVAVQDYLEAAGSACTLPGLEADLGIDSRHPRSARRALLMVMELRNTGVTSLL